MNDIVFHLDRKERLALAGDVEYALSMAAQDKLQNPLLECYSRLVVDSLRGLHRAISSISFRRPLPAFLGLEVFPTRTNGARIVVDGAYAGFTSNLLSIVLQRHLMIHDSVVDSAVDEVPTDSPDQARTLADHVRELRQLQRKILTEMIKTLDPPSSQSSQPEVTPTKSRRTRASSKKLPGVMTQAQFDAFIELHPMKTRKFIPKAVEAAQLHLVEGKTLQLAASMAQCRQGLAKWIVGFLLNKAQDLDGAAKCREFQSPLS